MGDTLLWIIAIVGVAYIGWTAFIAPALKGTFKGLVNTSVHDPATRKKIIDQIHTSNPKLSTTKIGSDLDTLNNKIQTLYAHQQLQQPLQLAQMGRLMSYN